ncbi:hypothetical protein OE749_08400 [Aestuariibacter sp. AA17]|uniref:Uncharacterized protein n=1 Tax=Fluctibacter corallii TaxID=2984329 RepID=A0ABT3A7P9_9ALTE|nr:hypothetical protein [Aestuariibacter sp. AA17]MCV2884714.1 hypothetical protein [Aestuariibacter sp. AA17]
MISRVQAGGFYIDQKGQRQQFPLMTTPTFHELHQVYFKHFSFEGVLEISKHFESGEKQTLELSFCSSRFLLSIRVIASDGTITFYTMNGMQEDRQKIKYFMGEPFPSYCVVSDLNLVFSVVSDFLENNSDEVSDYFVLEEF